MKPSALSSSRRWWLAAALVLALTTAITDAVKIDTSNAVAPSDEVGQYQTLEKTWTISGSSSGGLRNLFVAAPTTVFVDYDPSIRANSSDVAAKVVVTGDSEDQLDAFDVVSWNKRGEDGIQLRFFTGVGEFRGHLHAKILVGDKQTLRTVNSAMWGDIVIADDVLAVNDATASLELAAFSSGDVRVLSTQKLAVKTLALSSHASGDVEIQAPSIDAVSDISVTAFASGDVAVIAESITTGLVSTKTGASGDVYIQADNLVATTLDTLVGGSGDVTLSRNGKCVNQTARVTRSGDYLAGSIVSEFADIGVFASGDALVQVTDQLVATIMASGAIQYVNAPPKEVLVHSRSDRSGHKSSKKKTVTQASQNKFATFTPSEIPHRAPEFVVIGNPSGWDFLDEGDSGDDHIIVVRGKNEVESTSNLAAVVSSSAHTSVTTPVVFGLVGVVMGVAGVAAAAFKFGRPQRNREESSRLI